MKGLNVFGIAVAGVIASCFAVAAEAQESKPAELKIGMIGLDTSHAPAFTKLINDPEATGPLSEMRVVAAFPGGSPDIASSRDRVEGFTNQLADLGVEIVDSVEALLPKVDAVLLESVDGRRHLEQVVPVFRAGLPVFIDKPLAGSLPEALAIGMLAEKYDARWFSSSSLRFSPTIYEYRADSEKFGSVAGASAWSPCSYDATHPDLFWYGVHGVETLYTVMGEGCQQVTRAQTDDTDLVTGVWDDGRIGTFRGMRAGKRGYGVVVFTETAIDTDGTYGGYAPLVEEIGKFFRGAEPPVAASETEEIFVFMEAADESKRQAGKPVKLADVRARAKAEAEKIVARIEGE